MTTHPDDPPGTDDPQPRGTLPAPGTPEPTLSDLVVDSDVPLATDRVDAGAAVTGAGAGTHGEAPPGGIPGDDGSLEGGSP